MQQLVSANEPEFFICVDEILRGLLSLSIRNVIVPAETDPEFEICEPPELRWQVVLSRSVAGAFA